MLNPKSAANNPTLLKGGAVSDKVRAYVYNLYCIPPSSPCFGAFGDLV